MDNTAKPRLSYEEFIKRIGQLPAVQEMVEETIQIRRDDEAAARTACLAELKTRQNNWAAAQAAFKAAEAEYKERLANLDNLRLKMLGAEIDQREAQRLVLASSRDLHHKHGECYLTHASAVLGALNTQVLGTIRGLQILVDMPGSPPKKAAFLEAEKAKLVQINSSKNKLDKLILIDGLSPDDIKAQADEILKSVDFNPSQPHYDTRG